MDHNKIIKEMIYNYYYKYNNYNYDNYFIKNNNIDAGEREMRKQYEIDKRIDYLKEYIDYEIHKQSTLNPLQLTDEEKLDSINIGVIEKYLRKKKLQRIKKDDSK